MAVYGVDFYLRSKYGSNTAIALSVAPFSAMQLDYGTLALAWNTPFGVTGDWRMRLVRNITGYSATEIDGIILLDEINGVSGVDTNYIDSGLTPGIFYYYTIFLGIPFFPWVVGQTYYPGDTVSYASTSYIALVETTATPGTNPAIWQAQSNALYNWLPAGALSSLVVADHGYAAQLYNLIPTPYKVIDVEISAEDSGIPVTPALQQFMGVFGFSLDTMATEYDNLLNLNDPLLVSDANSRLLAAEFGIELEQSVSASTRRGRLQSQSAIARERGTEGGLIGLINTALGWDAEVTIGPNLMLNADQSDFNNPTFPAWDPSINYPAGLVVTYQGYVYAANTGGAYGNGQAPSGINTSNTWWSWNTAITDTTLLNPSTGGYSTWGAVSYTTGISPALSWLSIQNGLQNALNSADYSSNAAYLTNGSGSTADIGANSIAPINAPAWSSATSYILGNYVTYSGSVYNAVQASTNVIPSSDPNFWVASKLQVSPIDPLQVVRDGIPTPATTIHWSEQQLYNVGDSIEFGNYFYTALIVNIAIPPSGRPNSNSTWQWAGLSQDFFTLSGYAQTQIANPAPDFTRMVTTWYGPNGGLLATAFPPTNHTFFDFFDDNPSIISHAGHSLSGAYGVVTPTWTESNGSWPTLYGRVYALPSAGPVCTLSMDPARLNYCLGLTFETSKVGKDLGLVFRMLDSNNFYGLSKAGLFKYSSGVQSAITPPSTAINDGDRVLVTVNGNVLTVQKYGPINKDGSPNLITVISTTDTFNSTYTRVGLFCEF